MKELDTTSLLCAFDYQINLFLLHLCLLAAGKSALQTDVALCSNLTQQNSALVNGGRRNPLNFQAELWFQC